jgi:hypothetical protein
LWLIVIEGGRRRRRRMRDIRQERGEDLVGILPWKRRIMNRRHTILIFI